MLPLAVVAAACVISALASGALRYLPLVRTAAVASALTVVVLGLLPEATSELGLGAVVIAALGFVLPGLLARFIGHSHRTDTLFTLAALSIHQVIDGAQVVWMGSMHGAGVAVAVVLHGAALSAAGVVSASSRGSRAAWTAVAVLVGATALGGGIGLGAAEVVSGPGVAWIRAGVAGLLLHTLLHDVRVSLPEDGRARLTDLLVAAISVAVVATLMLGAHVDHDITEHVGHAHDPPAPLFLAVLLEMIHETAPMLLLGFIVGAGIQALGSTSLPKWVMGGTTIGQAVREWPERRDSRIDSPLLC